MAIKKNDTFSGKGVGIADYKMDIFDRWGLLIYETTDINKPWDGKVATGNNLAQIDVYIYKINVSSILHKQYYYEGNVNLVR